LGSSGIETAEILQAYCAQLHPTAVILVDSLAAVSLSRVGTTVQMTDTGICPGSGVGNSRRSIDQQVCGCPVIAIGIPTVVDASAIICQAITALGQHWQEQGWDIPEPDEDSCFFVKDQLLKIFQGQLTMTPKDIDRMMDIDGELLAATIALAIHPSANGENYHDFIHY